jgi:hypothetical protein
MWVLEVCSEYQVDINYPEYFDDLLAQYNGPHNQEDIANWLRAQIPDLFRVVGDRPHWIQEPDWPFHDGEPMIFLGQVDVNVNDQPPEERIYHDDTSLYLFKARHGKEITVVMQQY